MTWSRYTFHVTGSSMMWCYIVFRYDIHESKYIRRFSSRSTISWSYMAMRIHFVCTDLQSLYWWRIPFNSEGEIGCNSSFVEVSFLIYATTNDVLDFTQVFNLIHVVNYTVQHAYDERHHSVQCATNLATAQIPQNLCCLTHKMWLGHSGSHAHRFSCR